MTNLSVKETHEKILPLLIERDISVMSSFSAERVYIKINAGVDGTLQICNECSEKSSFGYKYNLVLGLRQTHSIDYDNRTRYFYSPEDLVELCDVIKKDMQAKVEELGSSKYNRNIDLKLSQIRSSTSKWKNVEILNKKIKKLF